MGTKKHSEAVKHALSTSQTKITAATFQRGTVDDKVTAAEIVKLLRNLHWAGQK